MLTEKDVAHLAELAHIALTAEEKRSLLRDLEGILAHFEELKGVDTEHVPPMAGGTRLTNALRGDGEGAPLAAAPVPSGVEAFPETRAGFLKVPPVFSAEGGSASGGE